MQGMLSFAEKEEIVNFVSQRGIKILNLCHIPEDGRLKTLSFSASDKHRVYEILEFGERVDGSSLFSFIEPGKSDIYITPKLNRAFINPFSQIPTLNILCDYFDENGKLLEVSPKSVLLKAEEKLRSKTGIVLKALAELEFYIISRQKTDILFPVAHDKNYHESTPFTEFEDLRNEVLAVLADVGVPTKYGHSEVGKVITKDGTLMEQQEIEPVPQKLVEMAETVAIAKWVIRNICARHSVSASFSPKIFLEHAGNGMHTHLCGLKNDKNIIANSESTLSTEALIMIGGILRFAQSLTAFGNPTPASYLRFIARKESPMHICWNFKNRLALIRVPLWWSFKKKTEEMNNCRETIEYRGPDPMANPYLLFAGIAIAIKYGFENPKEAMQIAENLHVEEAAKRKNSKICPAPAMNLQKT
ncbi:MAG: glutamine synthetase beta-grasp domain-containing protein [Candidatus Bathycorpusculaceae bacterium]